MLLERARDHFLISELGGCRRLRIPEEDVTELRKQNLVPYLSLVGSRVTRSPPLIVESIMQLDVVSVRQTLCKAEVEDCPAVG